MAGRKRSMINTTSESSMDREFDRFSCKTGPVQNEGCACAPFNTLIMLTLVDIKRLDTGRYRREISTVQ